MLLIEPETIDREGRPRTLIEVIKRLCRLLLGIMLLPFSAAGGQFE